MDFFSCPGTHTHTHAGQYKIIGECLPFFSAQSLSAISMWITLNVKRMNEKKEHIQSLSALILMLLSSGKAFSDSHNSDDRTSDLFPIRCFHRPLRWIKPQMPRQMWIWTVFVPIFFAWEKINYFYKLPPHHRRSGAKKKAKLYSSITFVPNCMRNFMANLPFFLFFSLSLLHFDCER